MKNKISRVIDLASPSAPEMVNAILFIIVLKIVSKLNNADFANFGVFLAFQSTVAIAIGGGRSLVFEKIYAASHKECKKHTLMASFFWENTCWAILVAPLAYVLMVAKGFTYDESLLTILSGYIIACWPTWLNYVDRKFKPLHVFFILPKITTLLPFLFFSASEIDVYVLIYANSFGCIILMVYAARNYMAHIKINQPKINFKTPRWIELATLINSIMRNGSLVILSTFFSVGAVALYLVLEKMARAYQGMINSIMNAEINKVIVSGRHLSLNAAILPAVSIGFVPISVAGVLIIFNSVGIAIENLVIGAILFSLAMYFGVNSFLFAKLNVFGSKYEKIYPFANVAGIVVAYAAAYYASRWSNEFLIVLPILIGELGLYLSMRMAFKVLKGND